MRNTGSHISNNTYHSNEIRGGEKKVMKKSLSVILSTTMALSAFSTAALAATSKDFSDLDKLSAADKVIFDKLIEDGIFLGVGEGKFGVDEAMKRDQFAVAIVKAFKLTADATTSTFPDVKEDAPELRFIEAAYKAGIANGNKDGTFNPKGEVSVQELAVFLVGALGPKYKEEARAATGDHEGVAPWAQGYVTTALKYNLLAVDVEEGFDGFAAATRYQLAKGVAAAAAKVAQDQKATKVESVSASNLKEILVTFDGQVDKEEAEKINNYKLNDVSLTAVSKATVLEDGASVLISLQKDAEPLVNQRKYTLSVNISGLSNNKVDFTPLDVTVPEVTSVEILGNKVINVKFSEPVTESTATTRANYKVNGYVVNGEIKLSDDEKTATITLYNRLKAGENKVTVTGVKDFAGMTIVNYLDQVINVAEDNQAPASFTIESATLDAVTVKFDEAVDEESVKASNIYWSDNAGAVKHTASSVSRTDSTFTTYKIVFNATKLPARDTVLYIENVMDMYGNTAAKLSANVNASVDITRPEVLSIDAYTDKYGKYTPESVQKLDVKFNKAIDIGQFTGDNKENLVVKNSKGEVVAVASHATIKSGNTLTVTLTDPLSEGTTYTVDVKNVVDGTALNNKMIPQTLSVTIPQVNTPVLKNVAVTTDSSGTRLQVVYNKAMSLDGEYGILRNNAYMIQVNNTWYQLPYSASLAPTYDNRAVVIDIPADATYDGTNKFINATITGFKVSLVADTAGNRLVTKEVFHDGNGGVNGDAHWGTQQAAVVADSVIAKEKKKIQIKLDRPLQYVYASDFLVNGVPATAATHESVDGQAVITLTLADELTANVTATVSTIAQNNIRSIDLLGNKIADINNVVVRDGIAPSLEKVGNTAVWAVAPNQIILNFDEALTAPAGFDEKVLAGMFTVKTGWTQDTLTAATDYTAEIGSNPKQVVITITKAISNVGKITVASNDAAMYIFDANAVIGGTDFSKANKVKFGTTDVSSPNLINVVALSDTTITSSVYTVNSTNATIANVPYDTDVTVFTSNLTSANGASIAVQDSTNAPKTAGSVVTGDKVVVTSANGNVTKTYTVTVNAPSTDTSLTSTTYTVSGNIISAVPQNTVVADFINGLVPAHGATITVVETDGSTPRVGDVITGDKVIVTAQDGNTNKTYTVVVDG